VDRFLIGSGSTVAPMQILVDLLSASFDVAANDPRGMGESDVPPRPVDHGRVRGRRLGPGRPRRVADLSPLRHQLRRHARPELAVTWPERVERLVLACTSPGGEGGSSYPLQDLAALPAGEQRRVGFELLDTRFTPEHLAEHPKDAGLAEVVAGRAGAEDAEQQRGAAEQMATRAAHDVCDRLDRIACPTLVAGGRYDGIAPPVNGAFIAAHVPGAEHRLYEGGHAFFAQDPATLSDIVAFLSAPF